MEKLLYKGGVFQEHLPQGDKNKIWFVEHKIAVPKWRHVNIHSFLNGEGQETFTSPIHRTLQVPT